MPSASLVDAVANLQTDIGAVPGSALLAIAEEVFI
jgi:hypothetical protein